MWNQPNAARFKASDLTSTRHCTQAALILMWIPTCCRRVPVHGRVSSCHSLRDVILGDRIFIRAVCGSTLVVFNQKHRIGETLFSEETTKISTTFTPHDSPGKRLWNNHLSHQKVFAGSDKSQKGIQRPFSSLTLIHLLSLSTEHKNRSNTSVKLTSGRCHCGENTRIILLCGRKNNLV